ncbi:hypothetical protein FJ966_18345 [Mesorhizobium sp. B2-1-5]|nr:hypothetical protein FJ966_18345 [Mesorhizobium sp. B2-1-5]
MWDAIQHVSSAFSLVAFVVAAAVYAYRSRLQTQSELVKSAVKEDRPGVVEAIAERFSVDTRGLTRTQKAEIVLRQIDIRARRELMVFVFFLVVAVLAGFITIVSLLTRPQLPSASNPAPIEQPPVKQVAHFVFCVGERADKCGSGQIHFGCGTDPTGTATVKCRDEFGANASVVQLSNSGGNKCGYGVYDVVCSK